jgi:hypothetical protein
MKSIFKSFSNQSNSTNTKYYSLDDKLKPNKIVPNSENRRASIDYYIKYIIR